MADPITDGEGLRVVAVLTAHWPHPVFTPPDALAFVAALRHAGVGYQAATDAVRDLIAEGREYQPRAPHVIAAHRRRRAAREGMVTASPDHRLEAHAGMSEAEADAALEAVTDPRLRELAQRAVANLRRRSRL